MLPCAAALGHEPPAGRAGARAGGRRGASWSAIQWKVAVERIASACEAEVEGREVGHVQLGAVAQALARRVDHRGRLVDADHAPVAAGARAAPR